MFASRLHLLANNLCVVLPNGDKNKILNACFFHLYLKVNYGLVIIIRFCHWLIIHDDKTEISYIMHRHQTLYFSFNFNA